MGEGKGERGREEEESGRSVQKPARMNEEERRSGGGGERIKVTE